MKRIQLRPVINQGKAIAESVKVWGIVRLYKTRRSLRRTFAKKRNQRKAIYIGGAILIISLVVGWSVYHDSAVATQQNLEQHLEKKEAEEQRRTTELKALNSDLDEVQKQKTDTEAQLKAKAEAEAQLKQQIDDLNAKLQAKLDSQRNEQLASVKSPSSQPTSSGGSCSSWIAAAGIADIGNASELINRESGCNPNAVNPSSGACGVAQELPCGKSGCSLGDGGCQVKWMASYVVGRYGSFAAAISHHNSMGWY